MVFFCLSHWIFYNLFLASSGAVLYLLGTGTVGTRKQNHHHLQARWCRYFPTSSYFFSCIFLESILQDISPAGKHPTSPICRAAGLNSCAHLWVNYLSAGLLPSPSAAAFFPWFVSATREQTQNPGLKGDNGNLLCVLNEGTFFAC